MCIYCYEKENNRTLHAFRRKHGLEEIKKKNLKPRVRGEATICPYCQASNIEKKGFRGEKQRYICRTCKKNWTDSASNQIADNFERENSIEEIANYLKLCEGKKSSITFYYRDKSTPTTYSNFKIVNDQHIQCFSGYGHRSRSYTYRIDRIRKI